MRDGDAKLKGLTNKEDSQLLVLDMNGTIKDDRGCGEDANGLFFWKLCTFMLKDEYAVCAAVQGTDSF